MVQKDRMSPNEIKASSILASIYALRMLGIFLILPIFSLAIDISFLDIPPICTSTQNKPSPIKPIGKSISKPVQLGLCCMNITLKKQKPPVYAARRMMVKTIDKLGIEELKKRITCNLQDLLKMMEWNESNGIRVFRLSSELFPHKTNPKVPDYDYDFVFID